MSQKIGVIGAGICGLTIGRLLRKQGYEVTLFDRSEDTLDSGSGLLIAPNGMRILRELGLATDVMKTGSIITKGGLKASNGSIYSLLANPSKLPTVGIRRNSLHQILRQDMKSVVHTSMEVRTVCEDADHVAVEFKNGQTQTFDYLIGTDGLHSIVRLAVFGNEELRNLGLTCWRGMGSRRKVKRALNKPEEFFEYWGRGSRFGYGAMNEDDIYWFAVLKTNSLRDDMPWSNAFASYADGIPELIAATPKDQIIVREILDRKPTSQWFTNRIVMAGDAIHPMTPNMGQGACMALESAWVLAQEISKQGFDPEAFRLYQERRMGRTSSINKMSFRIGQIGHVKNPLGIWLRSLILKMSPGQSRQIDELYNAYL